MEDRKTEYDVGLGLPDAVPELLDAVVVGVLADDQLPLTVIARHPAGVDVVRPAHGGREEDPGEVHGHVVHAVVVEVVGGVDCGEVLVGGGRHLGGRTELFLQRLPAVEALLPPLLPPLLPLQAPDELEQALLAHQGVPGNCRLHQHLQDNKRMKELLKEKLVLRGPSQLIANFALKYLFKSISK